MEGVAKQHQNCLNSYRFAAHSDACQLCNEPPLPQADSKLVLVEPLLSRAKKLSERQRQRLILKLGRGRKFYEAER